MKIIIICENNCNELFKMLHRRCFKGLWLYQDSEYASGSEYVSGFWLCQDCAGFWIFLDMREQFVNTSDYAWICPNIPGCTGICVNILKSAWMIFVLRFPIVISCLLECVVTYFNAYTKQEVVNWSSMRLIWFPLFFV